MAKILLVDDDVDLVMTYQIPLEARGHETIIAHSRAEANEILQQTQPDAMVLDIMMETPTAGIELAREAHEKYPDLPMLMVSGIQEATGQPFRLAPEESFLPAVQFLDKPVNLKKLAETVQAMLDRQ
jgi:DNA-binding NtrC family response regulator